MIETHAQIENNREVESLVRSYDETKVIGSIPQQCKRKKLKGND